MEKKFNQKILLSVRFFDRFSLWKIFNALVVNQFQSSIVAFQIEASHLFRTEKQIIWPN